VHFFQKAHIEKSSSRVKFTLAKQCLYWDLLNSLLHSCDVLQQTFQVVKFPLPCSSCSSSGHSSKLHLQHIHSPVTVNSQRNTLCPPRHYLHSCFSALSFFGLGLQYLYMVLEQQEFFRQAFFRQSLTQAIDLGQRKAYLLNTLKEVERGRGAESRHSPVLVYAAAPWKVTPKSCATPSATPSLDCMLPAGFSQKSSKLQWGSVFWF